MALKSKYDHSRSVQPSSSGVNLINTMSPCSCDEIEPTFHPFVFSGTLSIPGTDPTVIRILWDMGAAQSLLMSDVLPVSDETFCKSHVLLQEIEIGVVKIPLNQVQLASELVTGMVRVCL